VWWYVGGEYGGGSWTIERTGDLSGVSDQIDINDIRVYVGLECFNLNRYHAFAEVGYVFQRELVYVITPQDSLDLTDTFMLRAGVSF
jgi:hypothetical protein